MTLRPSELEVVEWHGEHRTLFYVVQVMPGDGADWEVLHTTQSYAEAHRWRASA